MSGRKWTEEQEAAISERGQVLVSAAAGSGKTAVLVERLLRRIMDSGEPVDVDRFLVVTFTKAAAQEMRSRIRQTLEDRLFSENDANASERLLRQLNRLSRADITTLHSFCLDLIRRYFYFLHLDPGFRVADEGETELLRQDVLETIFEQNYESGDPAFLGLVEGFGSDRGDQPLRIEVLRLYDFARSQADPESWLSNLPQAYLWQDEASLLQSPWGQAVRQSIFDRLAGVQSLLKQAEALAHKADGPSSYLGTLQDDLSQITHLVRVIEQGTWGLVEETLRKITFSRLPTQRSSHSPAYQTCREQAKRLRDLAKKAFEVLRGEFAWDLADQVQSLAEMGRLVEVFANLTKSYGESFAQAKRQRNIVDFSDLEHFALRLLLDQSTGVAESLKPYYAEVLVDEYQDINAVQERILQQVARAEENLFLVGDVKQSIYRFRMADPSLFLAKYKLFPHWMASGSQQNSGAKSLVIDLARNFRSRKEIVTGINFLFQQIMTEKAGEVEYDELAALQYGAAYAGNAPGFSTAGGPIEVHLLDLHDQEHGHGQDHDTRLNERGQGEEGVPEKDSEPEDITEKFLELEDEERDATRQEAFLVARRIQKMVHQPGEFQVYDAQLKVYRQVRYSDIVILMRSHASTAPLFVAEFRQAGIPVFAETGSGYFSAGEVETILSLLKIIDNPRQDIPLAAVLRSALVGFNGSELGKLRALFPQGDFYEPLALAAWAGSQDEEKTSGPDIQEIKNVLLSYQDSWPSLLEQADKLPVAVQEKAAYFWHRLQDWRNFAARNSLTKLIARIYQETGYLAYCGILPGGAQRQANLQVLYERAGKFEKTYYRGLFRFLRFLERFREQGKDMGQARNLGENENVVRIMTVHASKGLEFPVVFVVGLGRAFNTMSLTGKVLIHPSLGLGVPVLDLGQRVRYPSFIQQAVRYQLSQDSLAEELRILYVALTRAKEKLLLYGSAADLNRALEKWQLEAAERGKSLPEGQLRSARRYLDWIGPALARHRENPLRRVEIDDEQMFLEDSSRWQVFLHRGIQEEEIAERMETSQTAGVEDNGSHPPSVRTPDPGSAGPTEMTLSTPTPTPTPDPVPLTSDFRYLTSEVAQRLSWVYPWAGQAAQVAKTSVSELKRRQSLDPSGEEGMFRKEIKLALRPKFLQKGKNLTAAERGIALHTALQHVPLKTWAQSLAGLPATEQAAELERIVQKFWRYLLEREILDQEQVACLPLESIVRFFQSPLGRRMLEAEEVRREVPFTYALLSEEAGLPRLIQGVVDALLFTQTRSRTSEAGGWKVEAVDFKTDSLTQTRSQTSEAGGRKVEAVDEAEKVLVERYSLQMAYYVAAVERLLRVEVTRVTLYAFSQDREVSLPVSQLRQLVQAPF